MRASALDHLTELVETGLTLPAVHDSVVANFELTAHESHILLLRYDTILHHLDTVIMRRPRAQTRPSMGLTPGV